MNLVSQTLVLLLLAGSQAGAATLTGKVTGPSGALIPNARISVKNVTSGQTTEAQSDAAGAYTFSNLAPGDYEIAASAEGYETCSAKSTIGGAGTQVVDMVLRAALSVGDLGFEKADTQGSAKEQARLDKRTEMLKIHQRLGLVTAVPLLATVVSGSFAGGRSVSSTNRDLHAALGSVTAGMYFTTASFAIFAPKISGTQTRGPIRLHKTLAWIHGPGMILTPLLGALAFQQRSRGERVHGIAGAHGPVGYVTAGAYAAALLSVSF